MNRSNPLMNPAPRDFAVENEVEQTVEYSKVSKDQLDLGVESNENFVKKQVNTLRSILKQRLKIIEVEQFWKNPGVPFMIVSFFTNIIILLFGGIVVFSKLPPEMQLFYNPVEETWNPENKAIHVIVVPVILVSMFLIQYRFIRIIFRNDKRLGVTISWLMTLMNVFLLIAISQILSFYM